jgi:starch synthase
MAAAVTHAALPVLFATPECAPLVKVGGLGDVSAALPRALRATGIDVKLLLPGYPSIFSGVRDIREIAKLQLLEALGPSSLMEAMLPNGVPLLVLHHPSLYERAGGPYQDEKGVDWPDNAMRFGLLSKAAALLSSDATPLSWRPSVVHLNDWPTALASAYLRYANGMHAADIVTVHNLAFQGNFDAALLGALSLPPESYSPEGLEFHGRLSFLKAGLYYAQAITTVSPQYAQEIQTDGCGAGMQGLLRHRNRVLSGILNGIDTEEWNPASDRLLPFHYTAKTLQDKERIKRALLARFGFAANAPDLPVVGFVGRLTRQKGVDLMLEALPLLATQCRFVLLGTGDAPLQTALVALAERYPDSIKVHIGFDEALAHLIEAGADMFLMPSRFEPCGLNQMYSQRYGTPPIAHSTGGLVDTIVDCTQQTLESGTATGFLFTEMSPHALVHGIGRALALYRAPASWRKLQQNGMARDFSWTESARQYAALYRRLCASARD